MYLRRLWWLLGFGTFAVVPEMLVGHPDPRVGFQAWMVLQLLGVIAAAIVVAATFSSLGLVLVKLVTSPLRDRASVFIAWSFLKAARPGPPLSDRFMQRLAHEVDYDGDLTPSGVRWRRLFVGLLSISLALVVLSGIVHFDGVWGLWTRNIGIALAIHGALLAAAACPWAPMRLAPIGLTVLAAAGAIWFASQQPLLGPYLHGGASAAALICGAALLFIASRVNQKRRMNLGLQVGGAGLVVGAALLVAGLTGVGPIASSPGVICIALGGYLLLSSQPRVTLPVYVSVVGVASGTWALIVVLSVMGGFADDLRGKMLLANAHALIERAGRSKPLSQVERLSEKLRQVEGVCAVSPQVRGDAIISSPFNAHNFVSVRGVDPSLKEVVEQVGATVVTGSLMGLAHPEELMPIQGLRRLLDDDDQSDVPLPPEASQSDEVDDGNELGDEHMDAILQLAPGPQALRPPQRPPILLDSDGASVLGLDEPTLALPEPATVELDAGKLGIGAWATIDRFNVRAQPVAPAVLLGIELANTLQVGLGDRVELITPDADVGPTGLRPRLRTFRVAGTFETGLYEVDSKVAYVTLRSASDYFNLEGRANVVELRLDDPREPDLILRQVRQVLSDHGQDIDLLDWRDLNRSLFSALAFERLVIFLVLALIILVASFAIVSALTMVIMQKKSGIGMLQAMGASPKTVRMAFVQMGGVIGMIGTIAGLTLGVATCLLVDALGIQLPEAYYVRTLPVAINPLEVGAVVFASMAISLVATVFPAASAAKLRPLEGLRHE